MPQYNGNGVYIAIDSTDVSARFKSVTYTPRINGVEVTMGASATHEQYAEGLRTNDWSITLGYDTATVATDIPLFKPGLHTLEVGPEGTTSGKPKWAGSVLIEQVPTDIEVSKTEVAWVITAKGNGAPTSDIMEGDTY